MARTVLVTGGSGYIAGETIRQLLVRGWIVHTTVRNLSREAYPSGRRACPYRKSNPLAVDREIGRCCC